MPHPTHREQVQQREAKRANFDKFLCDDDDNLYELIEAAQQKRALEEPQFKQEGERE